jgi:hypothetical protein
VINQEISTEAQEIESRPKLTLELYKLTPDKLFAKLENNQIVEIYQNHSPAQLYNGKFPSNTVGAYPIEISHEQKELIDNIDVVDKNDFITKLELELEVFTLNEETWRKNQSAYFISKINILHKILKSKGVILKVISYSDDYKENLDKFDENIFVKIQHNGISFSNIFDFVTINKLRVVDDLGIDDSHPNFEAHEIVADNIYNSILKDPGYYTTFHSII